MPEEVSDDLEVALERNFVADELRPSLLGGLRHPPYQTPQCKQLRRVPEETRRIGSGGRVRTCDPAINSRLLYR